MMHVCSMYSVPGEFRPAHEPILASSSVKLRWLVAHEMRRRPAFIHFPECLLPVLDMQGGVSVTIRFAHLFLDAELYQFTTLAIKTPWCAIRQPAECSSDPTERMFATWMQLGPAYERSGMHSWTAGRCRRLLVSRQVEGVSAFMYSTIAGLILWAATPSDARPGRHLTHILSRC
jgi:hypothetical protein